MSVLNQAWNTPAEVDESVARPAGLLVLTLRGNRIRGMTRFLDDDLLGLFGLPQTRVES